MPPEKAHAIARGLKSLAQSYAEAGMALDASRAEHESKRWLASAISLEQTPPNGESQ
jgi:hypothetical protein